MLERSGGGQSMTDLGRRDPVQGHPGVASGAAVRGFTDASASRTADGEARGLPVAPQARAIARRAGGLLVPGLLAAGLLGAATASAAAEPITLTLDPAHPSTHDRVHVHAHFAPGICWEVAAGPIHDPVIADGIVHLVKDGAIVDPPLCGDPPPDYDVTLPPLAEGSWTVDMQWEFARAGRAFEVQAPHDELFLLDGRFVATLEWRDALGAAHDAQAVRLGDASGAFWFFGSDNLEVTLKMIDGRDFNHSFWVFAASTTDLAYRLTVVDRSVVCVTTPCPNTKTYRAAARHNANVLDTTAFKELP